MPHFCQRFGISYIHRTRLTIPVADRVVAEAVDQVEVVGQVEAEVVGQVEAVEVGAVDLRRRMMAAITMAEGTAPELLKHFRQRFNLRLRVL